MHSLFACETSYKAESDEIWKCIVELLAFERLIFSANKWFYSNLLTWNEMLVHSACHARKRVIIGCKMKLAVSYI